MASAYKIKEKVIKGEIKIFCERINCSLLNELFITDTWYLFARVVYKDKINCLN